MGRLTFILLSLSSCFCHAQEDRPLPPLIEIDTSENELPEQIVFQKRAADPVIIDVRRDDNKVSVVARNTAWFPYALTFRFHKIRNLLPDPDSTSTFVIYPGSRVLMNFRVFEPTQDFDFSFKVDKKIGDPGAKVIKDFPYLMPLGKNKSLEFLSDNVNDTQDLDPVFALQKGDTVYAMRRGFVTALPVTAQAIDRIASHSIELRHADGTIMAYENIDTSSVFVQSGETAFPGQPLGLCGSTELLVSLYQLESERLEKLKILFYVDDDKIIPFSRISNGERVVHPARIVAKEMNKRELKRMRDR